MSDDKVVQDRRGTERIPLEGTVSVKVVEGEILGPSRNISQEGIYFIAEAEMPVQVTLPMDGRVLSGKIVRVGAVRDGELGIAIRFDEKLPADLLPELQG